MSDGNTIQTSADWLRLLLDSANEAFYTVNCDGETTLCNQAFLRMLGFTSETEALGRKLHDVIHHTHPDGANYAKEDCPIYQCAQHGRAAHVVGESFYRLDGTALPVEYWVRPIIRDDELKGAICTFIDVTERRQQDAALADALTAKDALLQEVNHRVKNSLQLVMSMLSLQIRQLPEGDAKRSVADALARISVVAAVHRELYKSNEHGAVDLGVYLTDLVSDTVAALNIDGRLSVETDFPGKITLGIDRAVPLALIVCEAVTNCLKYAHDAGQPGTIRVSAESIPGEDVVLITVRDDGRGLPDRFDPAASSGLGMKIIKALARQIRSEFRYRDEVSGTVFELRLPNTRQQV